MKKVIAAALTAILVLTNAACSNLTEPETGVSETSGTTSATTAVITEPSETDTSETTEDPDGNYYGPARETEAAEYGDSEVADLCEFMQSITGQKVYKTSALVEDYYGQAFENSGMSLQTSYEEDPKGENLYRYDFNMHPVTKGSLTFNSFLFIANQEYGCVHTVKFTNSNDERETSTFETDFTFEELQQYYTRLEKELTAVFGEPVDNKPLEDGKNFMAYAEYSEVNGCTFRVDFYPGFGEYSTVSITCTNSTERKHFMLGPKAEEAEETDADGWIDIGDNYYKEAGKDDIVTDEKTGRKYVKNQLLISCTMGTPNDKEKIQKICEELDAEIVGYMEISSDFQIEFKQDKTYEELMTIAKELEEKYYYIISVTLNYAISTTVN